MCIYLITIISGIIIFIISQCVLKFFIDPIQLFKYTISNISLCLRNDHVIYQNTDSTTKDDANKAHNNLRDLGARLITQKEMIPFYEKISVIFKLPSSKNINDASNKLYDISNYMFSTASYKHDQISLNMLNILKLLNLSIPSHFKQTEDELITNINEHKKI